MKNITNPETLIVNIDGLRQNADGSFTLENVNPVCIDYDSVNELLKLAGVDRKDAEMLTDDFANSVFSHTLARQLSDRIVRHDVHLPRI
jgi:hypothetical protein